MRLWKRVVLLAMAELACSQITIAGMDGQPFKETTFTVDEGSWMNVDVSPDGNTNIFFLMNDIYAIPAKGGDARLIHGGLVSQRSPRFSPCGF